jgi:hypothetical protein
VAALPSSHVYPSGGDFATASAPIVLPAPGRLSTTIGWPSRLDSGGAMMRPRMSPGPPGEKGTIMVIGRAG